MRCKAVYTRPANGSALQANKYGCSSGYMP